MRQGRAVLLVAALVPIGGCGANQSVLNPMGPAATELAHLSWLLFAFGTVVLLIVVIASALAVRGSTAIRATLASPGMVVWGGIAFPIVTLTVLLVYGIWLTRASQARLADAAAIRIEVVGEQWWWRVAYGGPDGATIVSANEIRIPVGRPTLFALKTADVIHSFWVPSLSGKIDMIPGRTTHLRLQADQAGVFRGQCAEYCGGPHALMAFEVVAMPPDAFEAWLQRLREPAAVPVSQTAHRGGTLFLAAGCGACHTVRGTPAAGTIGPDLTHLGSRRSVGVDTAAMTEENIAAFIRDGQHIKPGNLMPPFRVFLPDDLAAVSAYLAGLR
jgi:cytochrome c oxidase subunit II